MFPIQKTEQQRCSAPLACPRWTCTSASGDLARPKAGGKTAAVSCLLCSFYDAGQKQPLLGATVPLCEMWKNASLGCFRNIWFVILYGLSINHKVSQTHWLSSLQNKKKLYLIIMYSVSLGDILSPVGYHRLQGSCYHSFWLHACFWLHAPATSEVHRISAEIR